MVTTTDGKKVAVATIFDVMMGTLWEFPEGLGGRLSQKDLPRIKGLAYTPRLGPGRIFYQGLG